MKTRFFAPLAALAILVMSASAAFASDTRRVVFHIDENDKSRMNLTLNNASNVANYYADKGQEVEIEVVAYGPGLAMFVDSAEKNPVHKRISNFGGSFPNIGFRACGNTMKKMTKKAGGKAPKLIEDIEVVPAGVVHLMERQAEGWTYIRP